MSSIVNSVACVNGTEVAVRLVKALYDFRPAHTDELAFRKGDVISVSQTLDGGWWEGTLGGLTGWFPSNYVKPLKASKAAAVVAASMADGCLAGGASRRVTASLGPSECHGLAIQQWVEQERRYSAELVQLSTALQEVIDKASVQLVEILADVRHILNELKSVHQSLMRPLEQMLRRPLSERMPGKEFLASLPRMRELYAVYFRCYPRASACLERHDIKKAISTSGSSLAAAAVAFPKGGLQTLRISLMTPLRQLDVYPGLMQELRLHLDPQIHADFNEIISVEQKVRALLADCEQIRRLQTVEVEIARGLVRGWPMNGEHSDPRSLGEVLHSGSVRLLTAEGGLLDRILLLFPHELIFISTIGNETGSECSFQFEERLVLSMVRFCRLETLAGLDNFEHAFELVLVNCQERRVVLCETREALDRWLSTMSYSHIRNQQKHHVTPAPAQPSLTINSHSDVHSRRSSLPLTPQPIGSACSSGHVGGGGSVSSSTTPLVLRPAPPAQPRLVPLREDTSVRSPRLSRKLTRKESVCATPQLVPPSESAMGNNSSVLADDMLVLAVIEAYATQSRARHTMNLLDLTKIRLSDSELKQKQADAVFRISSDSSSSGGGGGPGALSNRTVFGDESSTPNSPQQPFAPSVLPAGAAAAANVSLSQHFYYQQHHTGSSPNYVDYQRMPAPRRF